MGYFTIDKFSLKKTTKGKTLLSSYFSQIAIHKFTAHDETYFKFAKSHIKRNNNYNYINREANVKRKKIKYKDNFFTFFVKNVVKKICCVHFS